MMEAKKKYEKPAFRLVTDLGVFWNVCMRYMERMERC